MARGKDTRHHPNRQVHEERFSDPYHSERFPNPNPTLPCIGCEQTPTPERTSDGYAICHSCHTEHLAQG